MSVVLTGLASFFSSFGSASVIRTFRAFRPLRNVSSMPGLQALVHAVMESVPQLINILIILWIVFICFAIQGLIFFQGIDYHRRCRLTPYPVNMSYPVGMNVDPAPYRCLDAPNFNIPSEYPTWRKADSPWAVPQDCWCVCYSQY